LKGSLLSAVLLTPGAISEAAILREPLIADGFVKYLPEHIVGTLQSMFWLRLLLVLVLPGIWTPACADILSADPRVGQYMVGSRLQYLEDVNSKLAIRDVVSPYWQNKFRPNHRDVPNFGFTQSSYWFKLSLSNPASTPEAWILEARYPMLDRVDAYLVTRSTVICCPSTSVNSSIVIWVSSLIWPRTTNSMCICGLKPKARCNCRCNC
jgi:hypothetical protein